MSVTQVEFPGQTHILYPPPLGEEKATSTLRKGPLRGWLALLAPQKQARPGKASEGWASHQTRGSFERCLGCVVVLSAAALTQR